MNGASGTSKTMARVADYREREALLATAERHAQERSPQ